MSKFESYRAYPYTKWQIVLSYVPTLLVFLYLANATMLQLMLPLLVTYFVIKYGISILDKDDPQRIKFEKVLVNFWLVLSIFVIHPIYIYSHYYQKLKDKFAK